jgi:hypothetical protein
VNRLFTHPKLGHLLDNNEIDFAIMQVFEQLVLTRDNMLEATSTYAKYEVLTSPLFEALFDNNIIWKSKYYSYFCIEHKYYALCMREWLRARYASMNRYERLLYYLYKKQNGLAVSRFGVGLRRDHENNRDMAQKISP